MRGRGCARAGVSPVPKSRRPTLVQIRTVSRLVDACREMGDDPGRWRPHLLGGINVLVGAKFTTVAEVEPNGPAGPRLVACAEVGLPSPELHAEWNEFVRGSGNFAAHPAGARFAA